MAACAAQKSGGKMKIPGLLGRRARRRPAGHAGAARRHAGNGDHVDLAADRIVPDLGVFDLPFLFTNEKEADAVLDGEYGKYISDKLPAVGLVDLAYWENGFRNLANSKQPVNKVEDFPGLKVRVMQNNVFLDTFKTSARTRSRWRSAKCTRRWRPRRSTARRTRSSPSTRRSSTKCRSTCR